jgi:hypothetical protein
MCKKGMMWKYQLVQLFIICSKMGLVGGMVIGILYAWCQMISRWKRSHQISQSWFSWWCNIPEFIIGTALGAIFSAMLGMVYGPFIPPAILCYCLFRVLWVFRHKIEQHQSTLDPY